MASILTSCSTCSCSCSSSSQIRSYFYHSSSDAVSSCSILRRNHDYLIRGYSGLSQPISLKAVCRGCFVKRKRKGVTVQASLFGVGAPEALVIGVVALLVFGPKGLAEVARTLGKSLRSFQPTIRELQEVSREFKNTLEQEIGLDELRSNALDPYKTSNQTMRREPLRDQNGQMGTVFPVQDGLKSSEQIQNIVSEETLKTPIVSETSELNDRFSSTINSQSETTQTLSSNASELPASQIKMEDDKPK